MAGASPQWVMFTIFTDVVSVLTPEQCKEVGEKLALRSENAEGPAERDLYRKLGQALVEGKTGTEPRP